MTYPPKVRSSFKRPADIPKPVNPTLLPITRPNPYLDYESLSRSDQIFFNKMADTFLDTDCVSTLKSENYFKLMCVLHERRRVYSLHHQSLLADKIDELMRRLSILFLERKLYNSKAEMVSAIQIQVDIEENQLKSLETSLQSNYANLLHDRQTAIDHVTMECEQRLTNYDRTIPEKLPPSYCKLSSELLNLRQVEKGLIGSRRYQEADKIHKEFLKKQKIELKQQRDKYYKSFELERKRIESRNKRAMSAIEVQWERKVSNFKEEMDKKIYSKKLAVENLKRNLISAESEYIGEDDPILLKEEPKTFPKALPLERPENVRQTTYKIANKLRLSNRRLNRDRLDWKPQ
ncbi:hypothetical protein M9Y10_021062 [Tritrichomonas musculus]|uniref:Uncharacterized protein n=1 Tax=Tritrichomonas musculus TaxID=1915356 RepID=A0ABR2HDS0_9EUKA